MTDSIVLHQWEISPFCRKVAKALRHKGLVFDTVDYNGVLGAKAPGLSKVGKLPVLDINGQRIQDSTRIVRYLDEAYPELPRLYPLEPLARAQVELWEDWSDEYLYWFEVYLRAHDADALEQAVAISTVGRPAFEGKILKPLLKTALTAQVYMQGLGRMAQADVEAEFIRHLDRIELVLAQTGWLVGAEKTVADMAVGAQLAEVVRTSAAMRPHILQRLHLAAWLKQL